ncbi:MAG: dihydropteroate synthase [Propionibacteriaceae bacterium]|nr:dihydropteroate synthase [Propionibacteriaceae bacterium]
MNPVFQGLITEQATRIMGIVNVTDDSFAGSQPRLTDAIDLGLEMVDQGADIIDVGGESTRPGARRICDEEQMDRVIPVVEALAGTGATVSIDTVSSRVAQAGIDAGACVINDVSGGLADPEILGVAARTKVGYVLQHWRTPFDHQSTHVDVVNEVCEELAQRAQAAIAAGLDSSQIIVDPGIGFGKTHAQNWELLANAGVIMELGYPTLWGVSRKRFLADTYSHPTQPYQRDEATLALTTVLAGLGVWAVRTHTVGDQRTAIAVAQHIRTASRGVEQ